MSAKAERGWGVVRERPWHFAGLFANREDAVAKAEELGTGYVVKLGECEAGTDAFTWQRLDPQGTAS